MRIAVSALALRPRVSSGIARYCHELVDALAGRDSGHRITVYHSPGFEAPEHWRASPGLELRPAQGPFARYKTLWDAVGASFRASDRLHDLWFSTAHALPIRCPLPRALMVHDLFTFSHAETYTLKHRLVVGCALVDGIRRADLLLVPSEFTANELGARFAVPRERIVVTPLAPASGLRPVAVSGADVETGGLGVEAPYLLTLSTLEPRKNLLRLIEALGRIVRHPRWRDLQLVVVGARGWKAGPIERRVGELDLGDRVRLLGFVPDDLLPALFARAELFVLPSLTEGFGMPVLEAMRLGAPVVCSDRGAVPEVAGDAARYFDPEDVEEMAQVILDVLESPAERAELQQRGRERVDGFDWSRTAALTLEALETLT